MINFEILSIEKDREKGIGVNRENKGKSVNRYVEDYSVIDLETTSVFTSHAKIIEISAIKIRKGNVIDEFTTLVNPLCHIPTTATSVNHITDDMVRNAPCLDEVLDDFLEFIGDDIILGYNNAGFDMILLYDAVKKYNNANFSNDYIDLLHVARRNIQGLENYKLGTLCRHFAIETQGAHRALTDCYLTKKCYDNIYVEYGSRAFSRKIENLNGYNIQFSTMTLALQELQKILSGILDDGIIALDEIDSLRFWLEEHRELTDVYPFGKVVKVVNSVLEDGEIDSSDIEMIKCVFLEVINPVKSHSCCEIITSLYEKHVCLTGDFDFGSKEDVSRIIEKAGGIVEKSVKKSTDYVVVGSKGNANWKAGNYGAKIQKALEYIDKGCRIIIIKEKEFIPMALRCKNEPAMIENLSDDLTGWQQNVRTILEKMISEKELPEKAISLVTNYARDGKKITSYSISIYEPDYPILSNSPKDPTRNSIALNIKDKGARVELQISKSRVNEIGVPVDAETKISKTDNSNVQVILPIDSPNLLDYIKQNVEYALDNYTSKASSFGCCSLFVECSDAKHCIHENKLYSKACEYRKNLEMGRIFYGKNKTILD